VVDLDPGFSTAAVEPKCNVCSCCLYKGSCECVGYVLLDDLGEVVDLSEKNDPAIVGCIVVAHLFRGIVSLFCGLYWKIGF
jgi:hypothetical protein